MILWSQEMTKLVHFYNIGYIFQKQPIPIKTNINYQSDYHYITNLDVQCTCWVLTLRVSLDIELRWGEVRRFLPLPAWSFDVLIDCWDDWGEGMGVESELEGIVGRLLWGEGSELPPCPSSKYGSL